MDKNAFTLLSKIVIFSVILQRALTFQPEFAEPIVNISVAIGRDATFTCHVKHLGGYRVGWVKADTKAIQAIHDHVITHNPRVSVSHLDVNTWNLHIKSVTEEDRGGYMVRIQDSTQSLNLNVFKFLFQCQINTDPMKSQIGYLDVVIPPDFIPEETSSDVIVPEGSSVKLTCRCKGYPEPVVTWRREDGNEIILKDASGTKTHVASFRGETLKLTKIARNEMGSYLCIASNSVPPSVSKRISLNIHFHPVIHVPNQLVGAPLGTDVQIECHVEASPKSINYWIKDTGEMIVSSSKYVVQEHSRSLYEMKMTVTVKKFEKDDVGSYRCIAKNSLGEVDSSIRLYEIPGPARKVPPPKQSGSDTNEISSKNNKNSQASGKDSHLQLAKNTYQSPDYDDNYNSNEDDDFDASLDSNRNLQNIQIGGGSGVTRKPSLIPNIRGSSNGNDDHENNHLFSTAPSQHISRLQRALPIAVSVSLFALSSYRRLIT